MPRIVSLIASATEIVCALGFEKSLAGRSHECDFPLSIKALPVCTAPKFSVHGTSREIDQRVKGLLQDGLSIYQVDENLLRDLEPDIIVTQSQCEVCAVSLRDVERAVCTFLQKCPKLVSLSPNNLADVWKDIESVADALDAPERGQALLAALKKRIDAISHQASRLDQCPSVACIEWADPLMAAGNWVPELVDLAGGQNLFGEAGKHSPWMTMEQLRIADPEVVVLMPCGFDLVRTKDDLPVLAALPGWGELRAVREGRLYATDGNQYFNRPGPRLVESLEILAEILHPEAFAIHHKDIAWQRIENQ
jgi:iron complex transport system substrate-binding protein